MHCQNESCILDMHEGILLLQNQTAQQGGESASGWL